MTPSPETDYKRSWWRYAHLLGMIVIIITALQEDKGGDFASIFWVWLKYAGYMFLWAFTVCFIRAVCICVKLFKRNNL